MKKTILLIDDSKTQLVSLKIFLSHQGYNVVTANSGIEGLSVIPKEMPDLIISDILMPELNGYQFCRLLKNEEATKNIPLILLTSLNEKLDRFWGLRAGADGFVHKSDNFEKLNEEIEKFLKEDRPPSGAIQICNPITHECFEPRSMHSKLNDILDQALIESTIINEFRNLSEHVLDSRVLYKGILDLLSSLLDFNVAGIFFNDKDDKKEKVLNLCTYDIDLGQEGEKALKESFFSTLLGERYVENNAQCNCEILSKAGKNNKIKDFTDLKSKIIVPIIFDGKVLGGICLYQLDSNRGHNSRILNIILEELKILMRIRWLYSETKLLAITDSLTELYNRRYFQQALEREYSRAKRYKGELSVVMFDIDHFKGLNDTYGHQFGDKVLAEIAKLIKSRLRKTDYVSRYGGEEFVAILPETSINNAIFPIERLRSAIENNLFVYSDKNVQVTISIGIASLNEAVKNEQDLVHRADEALYNAKQNGRNRVEFYLEQE